METMLMNYGEVSVSKAGFKNPRGTIDAAEVAELADDIADRGLLQNLLVWRTEVEGRVLHVLLDGHRRYEAISRLASEDRLKSQEVAVDVFEGTLLEARMAALATHLHHRDLSSYDVAVALEDLLTEGLTQRELGSKIKKSQPWISRVLCTYKKASPELKEVWMKSGMPLEAVIDIADLPENEQALAITDQKALRASGKRKDKGKARARIKTGNQRVATKIITKMVMLGESAKIESPYVRGMMDFAKFAQGTLGVAEFGKDWQEHLTRANA